MKRDLIKLAEEKFDLAVIGAGIYGACIAWDASLRGLKVALLDKVDFGHATSANSLKTVHGGLRYLQQVDFKRMRESIMERRTLMRIAPHLVHPLPCLMPTYGHMFKGREVMAIALLINDIVGFDRNSSMSPLRYLPRGQTISRDHCLSLLPGINSKNLTGGAIWYDCQMYNSERLTLAFILSAAYRDAVIANYVKVTGFLYDDNTITGIKAVDELSGDSLDIHATTVVNASGPWVDKVLSQTNENQQLGVRLAKAVNISTKSLFEKYAVGLYGKNRHQDSDAVLKKGGRLFFVSPWRDQSLIGTTYKPYDGNPDHLMVTEADVQELLDEINYGCPGAALSRDEVRFVYAGLVPVSGFDPQTGTVQRAKKYRIVDHRRHGLNGLISVLGVKYTTARDVAEKVVDLVFAMQGIKPPKSKSKDVALYGGDIEHFEDYIEKQIVGNQFDLSDIQLQNLIFSYGSAYTKVLNYIYPQHYDGKVRSSNELSLLQAEIRYSVKHEMAQKLSDVIFRRTDIGTLGYPGTFLLQTAANIMGKCLSWSESKIKEEYEDVKSLFLPILRT